VPAYDDEWVERHKNLGLIVVPVSVEDDFVGLYKMVQERVKRA
jgi:energy-converting hydrogenase B subunit P